MLEEYSYGQGPRLPKLPNSLKTLMSNDIFFYMPLVNGSMGRRCRILLASPRPKMIPTSPSTLHIQNVPF